MSGVSQEHTQQSSTALPNGWDRIAALLLPSPK